MTCHQNNNASDTIEATCGAGIAYPSEASGFSPGFSVVCPDFCFLCVVDHTRYIIIALEYEIIIKCRKHCIILLRGDDWAHTNILTSPLFIDMAVPSQESERSMDVVRGIYFF